MLGQTQPPNIDKGPPTSKIFFHKILIKLLQFSRNFGWGPPQSSGFCALFQNSVFRKFAHISAVICQENQNFLHFLMVAFLKVSPKMSMGRVPAEIFGVSEFFYRKFVKKTFRGRGPQKSTFLELFSKIDPRNFCLGKTCRFF